MRRFLTLWLTLLGAFWLTRAVLSAAVFARTETDREAVWLLLVVPALQAVFLVWMTRSSEVRSFTAACRDLFALPFFKILALADVAVVAVGLASDGSLLPGLDRERLLEIGHGLQLALAGAAFGLLAIRGRGVGDAWIWLPLWGRTRVAMLAAGLALHAALYFSSGPAIALELVLGEVYEEYPWVVFTLLLAVGIVLVAGVEPLLSRRAPASGLALRVGAGLGLTAGLLTLLSSLPEPAPAEPWGTVVGILALFSATFLLLAPVAALFPREPLAAVTGAHEVTRGEDDSS